MRAFQGFSGPMSQAQARTSLVAASGPVVTGGNGQSRIELFFREHTILGTGRAHPLPPSSFGAFPARAWHRGHSIVVGQVLEPLLSSHCRGWVKM